jgi:5-hydroxyisourate hydrolase
VALRLELSSPSGGFSEIARAITNSDGRARFDGVALAAGIYRLTFDTGAYFAAQGVSAFYPNIPIVFEIADPKQHYHVPLLLSPFGYSTYRGS